MFIVVREVIRGDPLAPVHVVDLAIYLQEPTSPRLSPAIGRPSSQGGIRKYGDKVRVTFAGNCKDTKQEGEQCIFHRGF